MWSFVKCLPSHLLKCSKVLVESQRNTFILKRIHEIKPNKLDAPFPRKLKRLDFYYKLVEDTYTKTKPKIDLILLKDMPGIGMAGDKISANYYYSYCHLLLPNLAIRADAADAKNIMRTTDDVQYSSIYSKIVGNHLANKILTIFLSQDVDWTLEPWHVKVYLRRAGIMVNEDCIKIPEEVISGPNTDLENKYFIVKLTMNKSETFLLKCKIEHINVQSAVKDNLEIFDPIMKPLFPLEET